MNRDIYQDPLTGKYASKEMQALFSEKRKFETWRTCRIVLAETQQALGLDFITDTMLDEMRKSSKTINYEVAEEKEREIHHDVMAHIYEFGTHCPTAKGIIHLGATSQFVNDNTELLQIKRGLDLVKKKLVRVIANLAQIAERYKDLVSLGFTHYQPAQPTTIGKRMTLYIQDLLMDLDAIEQLDIPARGAKGTTGTQASYITLFNGDFEKVKLLDTIVAQKLGFSKTFDVTGQTYPRKFDSKIAEAVVGIAVSLTKFANDLRLLSNQHIVDEPFAINQTGSSAMAYKRNPMRSERLCALSRKMIGLVPNFYQTAGAQRLERTLDDSAIRRMDIPQLFLLADAILLIATNITNQDVDPTMGRPLTFYPEKIKTILGEELPFMATEVILMDLVKQGYDRQEMHELIKKHSIMTGLAMKEKGTKNDLFERLDNDSNFPLNQGVLKSYLEHPQRFAGAAVQQTEEYLHQVVEPRLEKYKTMLDQKNENIV